MKTLKRLFSYPPPPAIVLIALLLISLTGNVIAQTFNSASESVIDVDLTQSDTVMTHICGDLHELTETLQQKYLAYKQSSHSDYKSLSDYDPQAVHNCGSFTIIYADIDQNNGGGYDDPIMGEARRNTLCAVLNYVEDILYVHPDANPVIFVDASYSQTNPAPLGTGFLAQAGPYLSTETNNTFGVNPGIYEGLFADHIQTGIDPDLDADFDGYLRTNFDGINTTSFIPISYFNLGDPLVSTEKYDLFSTLLHEVTHILGFLSAMGENFTGDLACTNQGNSFMRFDWLYGYFGDILNPATFSGKKLLVGTEANPVINPNVNTIPFPLRRASVWINNQGPPNNHLLFSGNPSINSNVDFINQGHGSILSHFGGDYIFPTRQQFSPGKYMNYVMNYSLSTEEIRRQWTLPEIRMLLGLGYTINPVFAAATTLSPPYSNSQVIANSPPYRNDYNVELDFLSYNYFEPLVDHSSFPENRNSNFNVINSNTNAQLNVSTLSMNISNDNTLVDNDGDFISVLPETVFGIRGVSNGGNNHDRLQLDASGTTFTYTPEPGYYGRVEFGFQLWDGKELGAIEVYTIDVIRDPSITYAANEEMVINGNFEDGTEARTWENPEKSYTTNNSYFQPNLHFGLLHSGGHPFGMMGTDNSANNSAGNLLLHSWDNFAPYYPDSGFGYYGNYWSSCPLYHYPFPSSTTPNNTRYSDYNLGSKQISTLKFSMIPGENYILEFELAFPDQSITGNIFDIGDVLTDYVINIIDEPTDIENLDVFQTLNPVITVNTLTQGEIPSAWQTVTIPFTYCGDEEAYNIMFERIQIPGVINWVTLLDNISLKTDPNPPILAVDAGDDVYYTPSCDPVQLNASPSYLSCQMTYSWSPATGLSDPTILDPIATPTETTTYTITVTDVISGETATDEITVFVNESEIPNDGPIELTCFDEPINLTSHVNSTGGEFHILPNNITLADGILDPNLYGTGEYWIIYTIGSGLCQGLSTFSLTINPANVENFGNLTIECDAPLINLYSNVSHPGGNFGTNLPLNGGFLDPSLAGAGTFNVIYSLSEGSCLAYTGFTVTINPLPIEILGDVVMGCDEVFIDLNNNIVDPPGGTFTYNGAPLLNGLAYAADFGAGIFEIIYQMPAGSCYGSVQFTLTIDGNSTATHPNGLTVINNSSNDGATLTGNFQFLEDLIIQNGAIYTLSNAHVEFAEGKGIKVMQGAKLFIKNNSYLTNAVCNANWKGISVYGTPSQTQYGYNNPYQGFCDIKNSTIENAKRGIMNYGYGTYYGSTSGGKFYCYETTFKNCEISAELRPYTGYHPTVNLLMPVASEFSNCDFIWDEDYQFMNSNSHPMIFSNGVHQLKINGCSFKNTHIGVFDSPLAYKGPAIYAAQGSINMSRGCNGLPPYLILPNDFCESGDVPSIIEGFNYGIYLANAHQSKISKTTFKCYRGLLVGASSAVTVVQNIFTDLPTAMLGMGSTTGNPSNWDVPYGAYFNYSSMFVMKENHFNYPNTTVENVGFFIRASGAPYHQLYKNTFTNTDFGIMAYDDNRGLSGGSGLKIECNTFKNQEFPITTMATITGPAPPGWGISHYQGMDDIDPLNPGYPAGNYFTNSLDLDVNNELDPVVYFTHPSENLTSWFGITREELPIINGCPSSFPSPYGRFAMIQGHKSSADSVSTILATIIDNGNTAALTQEVVMTNYGEAVELYYDLMQVSPNLSEEVMLEAINKEFELPAALLTLILKSNPHAAKSGTIQKELDERMTPLSEYQREMINQGLELISYKENLEALRSFHDSRYLNLLNELIIETLSDTTVIDKIGSIENLIDGYEVVDHYYFIIELYLERRDVISAQAKLNAIATDFNLDPRRDAEYADFIEVYSIIFDKVLTGDTTLTPTEYDQLMIIGYRHSTLAAGLALVTLNKYAGFEFYELLVEPDLNPKSNKVKLKTTKETKLSVFKVYPNPTAGILIIEIPSEYDFINVKIVDSSGRQVFTQNGLNNMETINLRTLAPGSYTLTFLSLDGKNLENHKVQIAK